MGTVLRPLSLNSMATLDRAIDDNYLEAQLLDDPVSYQEDDDYGDGGRIIYRASFEELEENYVNYKTMQWVLFSLLLFLAWGVGFIMLLYLPLRRYVVRQDFRSRKLYVTSNAIVYKVTKPVFLPCFGVMRREKHLLLPLVTDVVIEQGMKMAILLYSITTVWIQPVFLLSLEQILQNQDNVPTKREQEKERKMEQNEEGGCLQSAFGIFSIRFENAGLKRPPPVDDIKIEGVVNPRLFRKVVLMAVSSLRKEHLANKNTGLRGPVNEEEELPTFSSEIHCPPQTWAWQHGATGLTSWQMSPVDALESNSFQSISGDILLQKLEEVRNSVKRVELLIENQQCHTSENTT